MNRLDAARQLLEIATELLQPTGLDPAPQTGEDRTVHLTSLGDARWLWLIDPDELAVLQAIANATGPDGWCRTGVTALADSSHLTRELVRDGVESMTRPQPGHHDLPSRPPLLDVARNPHGRIDLRILLDDVLPWEGAYLDHEVVSEA